MYSVRSYFPLVFIGLCLSSIGFTEPQGVGELMVKLKAIAPNQEAIKEGPLAATTFGDQTLDSFLDSYQLLSIESFYRKEALQISKTVVIPAKVDRIQRFQEAMKNAGSERMYLLRFDETTDLKSVSEGLRSLDSVETVEFNTIGTSSALPDDEYFFSPQWSWNNIETYNAWTVTIGDSQTVIAILDSGVDLDHPDLAPKLISSGYDFVNSDASADDDFGHGTHVAGIAAAATNNSIGIAGVAWKTSILPVKVASSSGSASNSNMVNGIYYAVTQGADVINISYNFATDNESQHTMVDFANAVGVVIVASMGNSGDNTSLYPAAYSSVVAVGSTDSSDDRVSTSTYGNWINVVAPGSYIYSTWIGGTYDYLGGTSMAAPHVAGVAALILAVNPSLLASEVFDIIHSSADDLGSPGFDNYYGYGRVNAYTAVQQALTSTLNGVYTTGTADFNGDGKLDIWQRSKEYGGPVYVSLSTGSGFGARQAWGHGFGTSGYSGYQTGTADFNGDGKADFYQVAIIGSAPLPFLVWLTNTNGDGLLDYMNWGTSFGATSDYQTGIADFNGDGKADVYQILKATSGNPSIWITNTGGTAFNTFATWGSGFGATRDYKTGVADFNGDGKSDFYQLGWSSANYFYVWTANSGATNLNTYVSWGSSFGGALDYETGVADFNGDGKADAYQLNKVSGGTFYVWRTNSGGTAFSGYSSWGSSFGGTNDYQTVVADFDGNGKADAYQVYGSTGGSIYVWLTNPAGTAFGGYSTWGTSFGGTGSYVTNAADLSGDIKSDVYQVAATSSGPITVWKANTGGTAFNTYSTWATGLGEAAYSDP